MDTDLDVFEHVLTTSVGNKILEAASQLFRERGISNTSIDSIVDLAGTTKRTVYQRFGSKDHLVACHLRQRAHIWQSQLVAALSNFSGIDALEVVYRQATQWDERSQRGCAFVNAWAEKFASGDEAAELVRREKEWMHRLFTGIAQGDSDTGRLMLMIYEGAQVVASIHKDPQAFDQACRLSQQFLDHRAR